MQHFALFYLGLHCLQTYLFRGFPNTKFHVLQPSREKALLTLYVMTEMHFLLQKNLKNIMHGRVKMYVMR